MTSFENPVGVAEEYVLCITTTDSEEVALRIKDSLLEKRLAACVSILPLCTSYFWWEGEVEKAREFLMIIKSRAEKVDEIRREVLSLHTYETPEFIVLPVIGGSVKYLEWIDSVVSGEENE